MIDGLEPEPNASVTDAARLRQIARQRLLADADVLERRSGRLSPGDDDLNPGALKHVDWRGDDASAQRPKPAAVLIGLIDEPAGWRHVRRPALVRRPGELSIIFTQRTPHLPSHAGQISFPGGKIDACDTGPAGTALREASEEIGLPAHLVEPLGFIDTYRTGTGYVIYPLVAMVDPGFEPKANPGEVQDVFTVPLRFLMDASNMYRHETLIEGRQRQFYSLTFEGRFIWGATAGMLKNLRERLF